MDGEDGFVATFGVNQRLAQVQSLYDVGQVERARQLAMDIIASDPSNPQAHIAMGYVADDSEVSLSCAARAIALNPDDSDAHELAAIHLFNLGRFAEAERSIRTAIQLDPADPSYHAVYAQFLSGVGEPTEALARAEHALALRPDAPGLHRLRAALLLEVSPSNWRVSEESVRTALRMSPNDADNHAVLGMLMYVARRNDEAEACFRTALALEPGHPMALNGLSEMVKARFPLYTPMLAFNQLLVRAGPEGALAIVFALWALQSGFVALLPSDSDLAGLVDGAYLALVAYTWFSEPITRALLRRSYPWLE